jgi:hypothetical protein
MLTGSSLNCTPSESLSASAIQFDRTVERVFLAVVAVWVFEDAATGEECWLNVRRRHREVVEDPFRKPVLSRCVATRVGSGGFLAHVHDDPDPAFVGGLGKYRGGFPIVPA